MNDEITDKFADLYNREGTQIVAKCATAREFAEAFFRRGFEAARAIDADINLKRATIRESFNKEHFESVQEAQRQTF